MNNKMKKLKERFRKIKEKEKEMLLDYFSDVYKMNRDIFNNFDFYEHNERIYILDKKASLILNKLNLLPDAIGFYLGKKERKSFRLSFDATQLFAKEIKDNILEIDENKVKAWFFGLDLDIDSGLEKQIKEKNLRDFVVIKFANDFVGVGFISKRNERIINYVPKDRRVIKEKS